MQAPDERRIRPCPLPAESLLVAYVAAGAYTDCYTTEIARPVSHAEFVEAFYTTALFGVERFLLRIFVARPSTGREAAELARGEREAFAAWSVEARVDNQLLLCDFAGRTRSWLMVAPVATGQSQATRLFFGSAVVPRRRAGNGRAGMGFAFTALLGFHRLYSRLLLGAAKSRLSRKAHRP